jgi:hypothetical protein
MPLPEALRATATYALNSRLRNALAAENLDSEPIQSLIQEAQALSVPLDTTSLEFTFRKRLEQLATEFHDDPVDPDKLSRLAGGVSLARKLPFPVHFWSIQNWCWHAMGATLPTMRNSADSDETARDWVDQFVKLCEDLSLRLPS